MSGRYIQYGCDHSAPAGWENFDASPTLRLERLPVIGRLYTKNVSRFPENVRYGDVVRGLPVAPDSCAGVYCSHILEHLSLDDARRALGNTYRYLMPGGIFRLVVPDLKQLAEDYVKSESGAAAHQFVDATGLGRKQRPRGLAGAAKDWLGNLVGIATGTLIFALKELPSLKFSWFSAGKRLAAFSFTLYAVHYPLNHFLLSLLVPRRPAHAGAANWAAFLAFICAMAAFCYAVYLAFERNAPAVRPCLERRLLGNSQRLPLQLPAS